MERIMNKGKANMSITDAIYKRSSVRSYSPERLSQTTIRTLLGAAVRAPTAVHLEPWVFAILQDTSALKHLSDRSLRFRLLSSNEGPRAEREAGFDAMRGEPITAERRRIRIDVELAMAEGYEEFVRRGQHSENNASGSQQRKILMKE
jgi:nitroreductase